MPHALSPRQREVATLIAEGLTNREVARTLSICERTFYRERLRALAVLTRVLADGACNSQ